MTEMTETTEIAYIKYLTLQTQVKDLFHFVKCVYFSLSYYWYT